GIVALLRRMNSSLQIVARTRFLAEVQALHELGADEVVPEEFETAVQIFYRTARRFALPEEEVERLVARLRADHYELLREAQQDYSTRPGD
ncbi:MAG: hypothetical protein H5T84_00720, partial [Thermoleophilia bacterium]|nr:hypothetical protein [Thermoleophilia bacterium]